MSQLYQKKQQAREIRSLLLVASGYSLRECGWW